MFSILSFYMGNIISLMQEQPLYISLSNRSQVRSIGNCRLVALEIRLNIAFLACAICLLIAIEIENNTEICIIITNLNRFTIKHENWLIADFATTEYHYFRSASIACIILMYHYRPWNCSVRKSLPNNSNNSMLMIMKFNNFDL